MKILTIAIPLAHVLIVLGLGLRVVMRRPPVGVALAWISVLAAFPFGGALLYGLFGEKRLTPRREALLEKTFESAGNWQRNRLGRFAAGEEATPATGVSTARLAEESLGALPLSGNRLQLIDDFHGFFDAIVHDIGAAERTCHLLFYIWKKGGRASDVEDALIRAAKRGVRCRLLVDDVGSEEFLEGPRCRTLKDAGVEVSAALPASWARTLFSRGDLRNHRKIVAIDGRVAYAGSHNLVDRRHFKREIGVGEWVDAMVRVEGPAAAALDAVFRVDWSVEHGMDFEPPEFSDRPPEIAQREPAASLAGHPPYDDVVVQVVPSGPLLRPAAIHQLLLTAVYAARRELVLTTPYFVPDESVVTALFSAALRGVDVTLIVPGRNDSRLVELASSAMFDDLLALGVRVARYSGGFLHTKCMTIDGEVAVFGSANLDMRSLWLNFESSLFIYDRAFATCVRDLQESYLDRSTPLDLEARRRRSFRRRLAENAARLLGPLL